MNLYYRLLTCFIFNKNKRRNARKVLNDDFTDFTNNEEKNCLLNTYLIHKKTFEKYKNMYAGRDVVIVGAGPTLIYYTPIKDAVHIGTNKTHLRQDLNIDFLFRQDFKEYEPELIQTDIPKFIGRFFYQDWDTCTESLVNKLKNSQQYILASDIGRIPCDLSLEPLWHGGSVAFSAFQFALYTNPKRIYLVGCDCAGAQDAKHWQHFDDKNFEQHNQMPIQPLIDGWKKLFAFAKKYYPETEIISINPVGLKGETKDIYTKEYLEKHQKKEQ